MSQTKTHTWVRYTQELVDAIVDPVSGEVFVSSRPHEPIGEATGCARCGNPMTAEFIDVPCVEIDAPAPAT